MRLPVRVRAPRPCSQGFSAAAAFSCGLVPPRPASQVSGPPVLQPCLLFPPSLSPESQALCRLGRSGGSWQASPRPAPGC